LRKPLFQNAAINQTNLIKPRLPNRIVIKELIGDRHFAEAHLWELLYVSCGACRNLINSVPSLPPYSSRGLALDQQTLSPLDSDNINTSVSRSGR
jgi:hypothetical protein